MLALSSFTGYGRSNGNCGGQKATATVKRQLRRSGGRTATLLTAAFIV